MKRIALTITLLLVLLFAGYLYLEKSLSQAGGTVWDRVPANAVVVFESKNAIATWNKLSELPLWESLSEIDAFSEINSNLQILDSLGGGNGSIDRLTKSGSLTSLHITGKNNFDFLYYIDLSQLESQKIANNILNSYQGQSDVTLSKRTYLGHKLTELTKGDKTFIYFIDDNILTGSFTSFLIEDVVRLQDQDFERNFKKNNARLFSMPQLANDDGNIYVNINLFSQLLGTFKTPDKRDANKQLQNLGKNSFLDVTFNEDKILFNGFTITDKEQFLNTFRGQRPVSSQIKYFVSNQTATFYQYSLSDPAVWHEAVRKYWATHARSFSGKRSNFEKEYNFRFDDFYSWIGADIAIANLETMNDKETDKLTYIKTRDANEGLNQLNTFSESLAKANGDTVYSESFSEYQIRELKVKDFPLYAFGPLFEGYDECYFSLIGDYIIMANNMQAMKGLITDIENEETWGRSVTFNKFLDSNLEEANVTFIFNAIRSWTRLTAGMEAEWKDFALQYASPLKGFNLGSLQFSKLDDSFYTSFALQYEKQQELVKADHFETILNSRISGKITTRPYVVRNHVNNSLEVLVQDSAKWLSLISAEGAVLWSDSLGSSNVSDIEQIDFYKNGKLQYFFATASGIHIIDRLGNYIDGYPVRIDNVNIRYATVVDYDKSKKYRFLTADERGNLYLFNKEGVVLEGWEPKQVAGKLASAPFHIRVRGKDCIIAIQQNGVVNAINRRGEAMDGFPLDLNARIDTAPFVFHGSDFDKTVFTLLSRDGKLIQFNLNGKTLKTEQLYRPTKETMFQLVPDALGKTYLIARQDLSRLVLLNADHKELLAKDYLSAGRLLVQYYNFNTDNKIYAITDQDQGFTYIYDRNGELVNERPIDSEHEIAVIYFEGSKKYHLYSTSGNTFKILTF